MRMAPSSCGASLLDAVELTKRAHGAFCRASRTPISVANRFLSTLTAHGCCSSKLGQLQRHRSLLSRRRRQVRPSLAYVAAPCGWRTTILVRVRVAAQQGVEMARRLAALVMNRRRLTRRQSVGARRHTVAKRRPLCRDRHDLLQAAERRTLPWGAYPTLCTESRNRIAAATTMKTHFDGNM